MGGVPTKQRMTLNFEDKKKPVQVIRIIVLPIFPLVLSTL